MPRWRDRFGQYGIKVSFCVLGLWNPQNRGAITNGSYSPPFPA